MVALLIWDRPSRPAGSWRMAALWSCNVTVVAVSMLRADRMLERPPLSAASVELVGHTPVKNRPPGASKQARTQGREGVLGRPLPRPAPPPSPFPIDERSLSGWCSEPPGSQAKPAARLSPVSAPLGFPGRPACYRSSNGSQLQLFNITFKWAGNLSQPFFFLFCFFCSQGPSVPLQTCRICKRPD